VAFLSECLPVPHFFELLRFDRKKQRPGKQIAGALFNFEDGG